MTASSPDAANDPAPTQSEAKCPVCGRPRAKEFRPFCSRRCRDVDLSRWMTGAYAIAGEEISPDDDEH